MVQLAAQPIVTLMKNITRLALAGVLAGLTSCALPKSAGVTDPGTAGDGNFNDGPQYTNAPELTAKPAVPQGVLQAFTMDSSDSKIYPGLNGHYTREVFVYVPRQYVPGTAAPFMVIQDGRSFTNRIPVALDNLIYGHRVPVMIAVLIHHGGGDGPGSERGLEYDTVSDRYSNFIEQEVLPRIARDYHLKFTTDPEGRATMGWSSGAACAFTMAWFHPELYRRVLSYSGTFVNQQSPVNPASPHGAWEDHEHLIPESAPKPLRVWLQVGSRDLGSTRDEASLHNWVMANERMASVLKAKGYHYHFVVSADAGHVDSRAVGETLPGALEWLWRGYPIK